MHIKQLTSLCVLLCGALVFGCKRSSSTDPGQVQSSATVQTTPIKTTGKSSASSPLLNPGAKAKIGSPAPGFTLPDLEGKRVSLDQFKGKTVVLEWFNPFCPFVKASHTKGSLKDAAKRASKKGIVWLAINSSGKGLKGHGVSANVNGKKEWQMAHPILLDELGVVGKAYGAKRTPQLFVIDSHGVLVYSGAVDNSPDGEGESPSDGKLVSYVDAALSDLAAGRPVATPKTEAYGCSVKYAP